MSSLSDALDYALLGWSIIPCHHITNPVTAACSCGDPACKNPGKHPRISWTQYQGDRPTAEELTRWINRWKTPNIGAVTGAISGIVVLDVDPRHGGDEALRDLAPLPDTVRSITGSGGAHLFFAHPGSKVPNSTSLVGPGLDVRGDGGFVILPPSLHMSERHYEWEFDPREHNVAPLPDWLHKLMLQSGRKGEVVQGDGALDIEGFLTGNRRIPLGERNHTMTRLAGYHVGKGEPESLVIQTLANVYLPHCQQDPAKPFGMDEVITIVHSITRAEARRNAATAALNNGNARNMGEDDLTEAARGLWAGKRIQPVSRFVLVRTAPDVVEYIIELPESEVSLGDNLFDQNRIRKALLNSDVGVGLVRQKDETWTAFAEQLRRCAIEVLNGPRRHVDQLSEWVGAWLLDTKRAWVEVEPGARIQYMEEGPCLIDNAPSLRSQPFLDWLIKHRYAPSLTMPGLTALLKQGGWSTQRVRLGSGARDVFRIWTGPVSLLEDT